MEFRTFRMQAHWVAPNIYGDMQHHTTNLGCVIPKTIRRELESLLKQFNQLVGARRTPYYRIDAYFDPRDGLITILEINASFVDGWGTALNLARAAGIRVPSESLTFPNRLATTDWVYLPELQLFRDELRELGHDGHSIVEWTYDDSQPIYVYGRVREVYDNVFPYDGLRLDNKLNLAQLSRRWQGRYVHIPRHFVSGKSNWDDIPGDAVLKFCNKNSIACQRARWSVCFGKPKGKAPFLRQCYREESLLAQEHITPASDGGIHNCQLVIMAIGNKVMTGYVQFSPKRLINDNSTHGPLMIQ